MVAAETLFKVFAPPPGKVGTVWDPAFAMPIGQRAEMPTEAVRAMRATPLSKPLNRRRVSGESDVCVEAGKGMAVQGILSETVSG